MLKITPLSPPPLQQWWYLCPVNSGCISSNKNLLGNAPPWPPVGSYNSSSEESDASELEAEPEKDSSSESELESESESELELKLELELVLDAEVAEDATRVEGAQSAFSTQESMSDLLGYWQVVCILNGAITLFFVKGVDILTRNKDAACNASCTLSFSCFSNATLLFEFAMPFATSCFSRHLFFAQFECGLLRRQRGTLRTHANVLHSNILHIDCLSQKKA